MAFARARNWGHITMQKNAISGSVSFFKAVGEVETIASVRLHFSKDHRVINAPGKES